MFGRFEHQTGGKQRGCSTSMLTAARRGERIRADATPPGALRNGGIGRKWVRNGSRRGDPAHLGRNQPPRAVNDTSMAAHVRRSPRGWRVARRRDGPRERGPDRAPIRDRLNQWAWATERLASLTIQRNRRTVITLSTAPRIVNRIVDGLQLEDGLLPRVAGASRGRSTDDPGSIPFSFRTSPPRQEPGSSRVGGTAHARAERSLFRPWG